jgi:hypothetical protein
MDSGLVKHLKCRIGQTGQFIDLNQQSTVGLEQLRGIQHRHQTRLITADTFTKFGDFSRNAWPGHRCKPRSFAKQHQANSFKHGVFIKM